MCYLDEQLITYVGPKHHAKDLVAGILNELDKNPKISSIELKARGRAISIAVDILEILKRGLNIDKSAISTNTTEKLNQRGQSIKTSEITITLTKKNKGYISNIYSKT